MSKRERMTLISLRLPNRYIKSLDSFLKKNPEYYESRSDVIRQAIHNFLQDTSGSGDK
jgi:metal-responsive CopG/Arc/MetJ family transcriptional regulator